MQNHDIRLPLIPVTPLAEKRSSHQAELKNSAAPTGAVAMDPRVTELETHLRYMRRDMDEMRDHVKSIKHRLVYSAGGTAVVLGLLVWIGNSRFDQLVTLLVGR
ncbi:MULTISPECIES: hypothetical protein [Pseudomonas]|jgi:hypothetical protein|uniref:Uncharacterized protein n=1 Tax=Pseudomonas fluorescens TaxID=294 RepID=A0A5E7VD83_PSEFL|nr:MULTISPECIES: hypothetical protein [Pseudomonas]OPK09645.1 hypothetical protein BZ163_14770 [Pseudomonas sp. VI4.1]QCY15430.1 hypothetical protein ELQ88_10125 [Pseudomonas sp. MPC6]VVQ21159.1 hypothetical protein PS928_05123 [Pseudomonas fluorescens]